MFIKFLFCYLKQIKSAEEEKDKITELTKENIEKEQIWGEHLNKKSEPETKTSKITEIKIKTINSSITKKLFANTKFAKRNPRKSQSFSKQNSSLNLSQTSTHSFSQPNNTSALNNFSEDFLNVNSELNSLPMASSQNSFISAQSVNVITQLLENEKTEFRKVNKGWLERISVNTGINLKAADECYSETAVSTHDAPPHFDYNSDDIISDSDEENYTLHTSKRIKLFSSFISTPKVIITERPSISSMSSNLLECNKRNNKFQISPSANNPVDGYENMSNLFENTKEMPEFAKNLKETSELANKTKETCEYMLETPEITKVTELSNINATKNLKKIKSDTSEEENGSEYEEKKPVARKRKSITTQSKTSATRKKNSNKTKKTTATKPTKLARGAKKEEESSEKKTDEYEIEYSIKPPPTTVPRFRSLSRVTEVTQDEKLVEKSEQHVGKKAVPQNKLMKKIESRTLNENFVRININKKVYVRGKRGLNFTKFKKQQWKNKKKALYGPDMDMGGCDGGELTCFKCGKTGHFSRQCKASTDKLLPREVDDENEYLLPSLQEASKIARDSALAVRVPNILEQENLPPAEINTEGSSGKVDNAYEFQDDEELEDFMMNADTEEHLKRLTQQSSQPATSSANKHAVRPLYNLNSDGSLPGNCCLYITCNLGNGIR